MQKNVARDDYEDGPGNKEAERKELEHIRIEPYDKDGDGVMSHTMYMHPRGGQGGGPTHEMKEETLHHATLEHLSNHLGKHLKFAFDTTDEHETDGVKHDPGTEAE